MAAAKKKSTRNTPSKKPATKKPPKRSGGKLRDNGKVRAKRTTAGKVKSGKKPTRRSPSARRTPTTQKVRMLFDEEVASPDARVTAPQPYPTPEPRSVEIDEERERVGEPLEAFHLDSAEGTDDLAEELAETYVENATGVDDAATEHRRDIGEEGAVLNRGRIDLIDGGPFVFSNGRIEFADDIDESNPEDATREALPRSSSARPN
jgi:hypothetical protein